jgi:hypothetical protein
MQVEDGTRLSIDQSHRFERPYVTIRAVYVVTGCRLAVEGTHSNDRSGVESAGTLSGPTARQREPIHLASSIDDLRVAGVHVNLVEMRRKILSAGNTGASWVTHNRRGAGGTAFFSQRCGLFNAAEKWHRYIHFFRFALTIIAAVSPCYLRIQ